MFFSFNSSLFVISTSSLLLYLIILSPTFCLEIQDFSQVLMFEEKNRLGSTPPSCHNKCNQCHPCMAVEVPGLRTSHNRGVDLPGLSQQGKDNKNIPGLDYYDLPSHKYSNYKPLGWKCRCNNHFYNP